MRITNRQITASLLIGVTLLALLAMTSCKLEDSKNSSAILSDTIISIPLEDGGRVVISDSGVSVWAPGDFPVISFNSKGSVHRVPEEFTGGIIIPLQDPFDQGGAGEIIIDGHGIRIEDRDGNEVVLIDSSGSKHDVPETFSEITVPLESGGEVVIDSKGFKVLDADGNLISSVDQSGSTHNKKETFTEIVVPLFDDAGNRVGQIQMNNEGLSVLDANNNFVSWFNETGSEHIAPEQFAEIVVPLASGGTVTINDDGITVQDENGRTVTSIDDEATVQRVREVVDGLDMPLTDENGNTIGRVVIDDGIKVLDADGNIVSGQYPDRSEHKVTETFSSIEVPLLDPDGNQVGLVTIDETGIGLWTQEPDGELVIMFSQLDLTGSTHGGVEKFEAIEVLLTDPDGGFTVEGKLVIDESGLTILDENGNLLSALNLDGSVHKKPEEFSEINIPLAGGGTVTINERGFLVMDAAGELVSFINATGSRHNPREQFSSIYVPLEDSDGNSSGSMSINENGITVFDSDGKATFFVDETGSRHTRPEIFSNVTVPLTDSDGNPDGSIRIDSDGMTVFDGDGNATSFVDQNGSLHNRLETFSDVMVPLTDSDGDPSGFVHIGSDGIRVFDAEGNLISEIDENSSTHNAIETFAAINVPLTDSDGNHSGNILISEHGIVLVDAAGDKIAHWDETGSVHNAPEKFSKITVPLASGGSVIVDGTGIRVLDADGNVINTIDDVNVLAGGGAPSQSNTVNVPLTDEDGNSVGRIEIDSSGLTVWDADGEISSFIDQNGSIHNQPESFKSIWVPLTDISGNSTGAVRINGDGITIIDADGHLISQYDESGSKHTKTETFERIEVPLLDSDGNNTGYVSIGSGGIMVFDAAGDLVSVVDELGSAHHKKEAFSEIVVDLVDSDGNRTGQIQINEEGLSVLDADDNFVSWFNETGSAHNVKETFSELVVPLFDSDGNRVGQIQINEEGLSVLDVDDNFVSWFNETGSGHIGPEEFSEITVPFIDGFGIPNGKAVLGSDGVRVYDAEGVLVGSINPDGSIQATTITASSIFAGKVTAEITDPLIAETFPVHPGSDPQPGDLVVADTAGNGNIRVSSEAEDTKVLGVVGPGATIDQDGEILVIMLGAHGPIRTDGTRLEALVKVDTEFGAIQVGDLITTSSTPGHGMKATDPKLGTIIGKALEPLESGIGLIRVFVSLG